MIQRGTVERVGNDGALYVSVPAYGDAVIGPLEVTYDPKTGLPLYNVGDRVLVGQIGNIKEEMVVIGRSVDGIDPSTLPPDADLRTPEVVSDLNATSTVYFDASGNEQGSVFLWWDHELTATDGTPQDIDHFEVRRKVAGAADSTYEIVSSVPGSELSATVTGIRTRKPDGSAESYIFGVRAVGANALLSAWTLTPAVLMTLDTDAPPVPSGVTATNDATLLVVRWDGTLVGDLPSDFSHIVVQRGESASGPWMPQGRLDSAGETTLAGLAVGSTRWFRAQSVDKTGNVSGWTTPVSATATEAYDDTALQQKLDEAAAEWLAKSTELADRTTQAEADLAAARDRITDAETLIAPLPADLAEAQRIAQEAADAAVAAEARAAEASSRAGSLLANGNFESGFNSWITSTSPAPTLTADARSGTQAAEFEPFAYIYPNTSYAVTPGQVWELTAVYKCTGMNFGGLDFRFTRPGEENLGGALLERMYGDTGGQWKTAGPMRVTIPEGYTELSFRISSNYASTAKLTIDDVMFRDVTDVVRLEKAAQDAKKAGEDALAKANMLELSMGGLQVRLDTAEQNISDAASQASVDLAALDKALRAFASSEADDAEQAAKEAAALDAQAKADAAQAAAEATAQTLAQAEATAAQSAATAEAAAEALRVANLARDEAIAAASVDAAALAKAAEDAAKIAAAADAKAKADAAQAEALRLAKIDAKNKADAAQAEALRLAKIEDSLLATAVHGRIDGLQNTIIPALQAELDAAEARLVTADNAVKNLQNVVIPELRGDMNHLQDTTMPALEQSVADANTRLNSATTQFGTDLSTMETTLRSAFTQADIDALNKAALDAQSKADAARLAAETDAKAHADALPKVLHGTTAPAGTAPNGSVWFQHFGSLSGAVTGQWNRVAGAWVSTPIRDEAIANLDAGKITSGFIDTGRLNAQTVAAHIGTFIAINANQITAGTLDATRINVQDLAARIATVIQLNADRITSGTIDAGRINTLELAANIATVISLDASRITSGQITADRIAVTTALTSKIATIIDLSADRIKTGLLSADRIDVVGLVAKTANIQTVRTDNIRAGTAVMDVAVAQKLFADIFLANKITAREMLVSNGNLFVDPYFEQSYSKWTKVGEGIERNGSGVQDGEYYTWSDFAVQPGDQLQIEATRKNVSGSGGTATIYFNRRRKNGAIVFGGSVLRMGEAKTYNLNAAGTYTVPADTTHLRVGFWTEADMSSTTRVRIEDVRITNMTSAVIIKPDSITAPHINVTGDLITKFFAADRALINEELVVKGNLFANYATFINAAIKNLSVTEKATFADAYAEALWAKIATFVKIGAEQLTIAPGNLFTDPRFRAPGGYSPFVVVNDGLEMLGTGATATIYPENWSIDVRPNEKYQFSLDRINTSGIGGTLRFQVRAYRSNGTTYDATVITSVANGYMTAEYTVGADVNRIVPGFSYFGSTSQRIRIIAPTIARKVGSVLIENGAVTAEQINVQNLAASNAFIEALSTSGLSLTQTINGLTTTLSGSGMIVSKQSEGGLPLPLVQVGGGTGTTVATYDSDGTMLGGLGEDGSVTATDLSSQNDPMLAGAPLLGQLGSHAPSDYGVAWFDQIGWGEVATARRIDHDAGTYAAGEHGLLQLNFTALPGRKYRVWADFGHLIRNGQTIRCRVRYTSDGATPNLNATILEEQGFGGASGPWNAINFWANLVGSSGENGQPIPVKLLMCISSSANMNFVSGTGWKNLRLSVEDVGPIRPPSGIARHVRSLVGEASGGSDQIVVPTTSTYTTSWEPNGFASYYAGGASRQTSGPGASMMKQGYDNYAPSLGQQTSLMWITGGATSGEKGKTTQSALSGANVTSGVLSLRNEYSAAGGTKTVRLYWHGFTSAPGSYNPTSGFIGEYSVAPGSRVSIPLPAYVLTGLKNGSIRGFGFSAGGSSAAKYNQGISFKYRPTLTTTYER